MKHRIRAAAIVIKDDKILLVKHVHPKTKFQWWVPPGGGLEDSDDSVLDCIKREVYEESGLTVTVDDTPMFIREFEDIEHNTLHLELFFKAHYVQGELTIENVFGNGKDEDYIKDVKWLTLDEIQELTIFPEELKLDFGLKLSKVYLGRHKD